MERQVRVEGTTERLTAAECEAIAKGRARNSRICDWASPQSAVISDRVELETEVQRLQERFAGVKEIPIPPFWDGLRVIPDVIEFWQGLVHLFVCDSFLGRENRLHDRFVYIRQTGTGDWSIERLAP